MDNAKIHLRPPHPVLAPYVQYVTLYTSTVAAPADWPFHLYKQIPNGNTRILFRVNYPGLSAGRAGSWKRFELVVMGPMKTLRDVPGQGSEFIVVTVKAGGIRDLLGVPAAELTDQILPLEHFWEAQAIELLERLVLGKSLEDRLRILEDGLLQRILGHPRRDMFVLLAAEMIENRRDWTNLNPFFSRTGYSKRQVERKFNESMGFGPKEFDRICRFKRLFGAIQLKEGKQDWTRLAVDFGYFDKSHFFHDFQKLIGQSPSAFFEDYRKRGIPMPGTPQTEVLLFSNHSPEGWFRPRVS